MKLKKTMVLCILVLILLSLFGCGNENVSNPASDKLGSNVIKQIEAASTLDELLAFYSDSETFQEYSDEEKSVLEIKTIEYYLSNHNATGIYFYKGCGGKAPFLSSGYYYYSDAVAISIVSPEEIYIVPGDVAQGKKSKSIPEIEGMEIYKYKASSIELREPKYEDDDVAVHCKLTSYADGYEIDSCFTDGAVEFYNNLPTETNENFPETRTYYLDINRANESADKEALRIDKKENEKQEEANLKKSDPKIGMTTDEVKRCAWGFPDDINKNVYSWGTTEQWVYDDKGYVYFENDIVVSVSYR